MENVEKTFKLRWQPPRDIIQTLITRITSPALALGLIGVIAGLIYVMGFSNRANLFELYTRPRLDGTYAYWVDPAIRWHFIRAFFAQAILYWLGWRVSLRARGWLSWTVVLGGAVFFSIALLFLYPLDAADLFDNIIHGRILGIYGANPFIQPASYFRNDIFFPYVGWKYAPTAYGPVWEVLAALAARMGGNDILRSIILFKLLPGIFLAGSIGVVWAYLQSVAPQHALAGVLLLAWNPMVLYETFGNGHNDMVMVFWVLLACLAMTRRRYTLAFISLVIGTLIKFIPALLLPAVVFISFRALPHAFSRIRYSLITIVLSLGIIVVAYAPFWQGIQTLGIVRRTYLYSASLPAIFYHTLGPMIGKLTATVWISRTAAALMLISAVWLGWRASRSGASAYLPLSGYHILAFYLLVVCLWFQQWYTLWLVGLAALLPPGHHSRLAVVFSLAALSKQFLIGPVLLHEPPVAQPWLEIIFTIGFMAIPWLYGGYIYLYSKQRLYD